MKLDVCGCCELPSGTPLSAFNRPGLRAIVFRVGTYSSFRQSMLHQLAHALSSLQTREDDDYAITIVDMWATLGDVLTFYQERIANEAYLRTGRLRDSVLRMARLLDYQLRSGVAASTRLAFTLDRDAALQIPVGLRVQSVPGDRETPQIYETLESIAADARLNRLRVLPAPHARNPLAKGSVGAMLAPGADGLAAAAAISPGTRLVLFDTASAQQELLTARELRVEEERVSLFWSGPIQGDAWDIRSRMHAFGRTFRLFGCNAPAQYAEPVETAGQVTWLLRTFATADFAYSPPGGNVLELDAKYEGIAAGTRLLICIPGEASHLATVESVGQGPAIFKVAAGATSPVQDTVTKVRVSSVPASIPDRRTAIILELTGPPVRFWGYCYPDTLSAASVLVPATRIDAQTVEIGSVVENGAFTPGVRLPLDRIAAGRAVMLGDASGESSANEVAGVAAMGLDATFRSTPDDPTTASELRLDAQSALHLIALRSDTLPASFTLTSTSPEVSIAVGSLPARTIALWGRPSAIGGVVNALQSAINAAAAEAPELAGCRVTQAQGTLIILPGVPGTPITVAPTPADPTTAGELGLLSPGAIRVDALRTGDLTTFPTVSNPSPELKVSFGPIGPRIIRFPLSPGTLAIAASMLRTALTNADPAPAFRMAVVNNLEDSLVILPGTGGASVREYLAISLRFPSPALSSGSAILLGNVARATHGETVRGEVLGDGNAAAAFQTFELQKKPLTLVSSAAPGGTESTLDVRVNDVRWREVPSLFGRAPDDLVYTTRTADDGTVSVGFGDGLAGARLSSGRGNVVATYRHGSGVAGRVPRSALRTPLDLPTGLKSVSNPTKATGGADPESLEQARENAPTTVRTFGRAISLRDFEDLARSSGEVAKAFATWVWDRETRAVHLTIAGQGGESFTPEDLARIQASVDAARDPNHPLFIDNHVRVPIVISASLLVQPTHVARQVAAAARGALLDALSFDSLGFGQPLALSEVMAILQHVDGVIAVDVDLFHFKDRSAAFLAQRGASADPVQRSLRIFPARPNSVPFPPVLPAEMAAIDAPADDVQIATAGGLPQ